MNIERKVLINLELVECNYLNLELGEKRGRQSLVPIIAENSVSNHWTGNPLQKYSTADPHRNLDEIHFPLP